MNHTPGPWSVNFKKFSEVRTENGALVLECKKLTGLVNLQANARLVAAAPCLLAALVMLVAGDEAQCLDDEMFDAARAAIAKAVGDA